MSDLNEKSPEGRSELYIALLQVLECNWFRLNPYISDSFRLITNKCEICFLRMDFFLRVEVRMTPSDYGSFFVSQNLFKSKFILNDCAPIAIGTKFSFHLKPFNGSNSFRMNKLYWPLFILSPIKNIAHVQYTSIFSCIFFIWPFFWLDRLRNNILLYG